LQNALMPRNPVFSDDSHCIDSASVIRPFSISSLARSSVCASLETSYPLLEKFGEFSDVLLRDFLIQLPELPM